jgi:hypothetical protein
VNHGAVCFGCCGLVTDVKEESGFFSRLLVFSISDVNRATTVGIHTWRVSRTTVVGSRKEPGQ